MGGPTPDVIIYSRFHQNPFRGFGIPEGRKFGFSITFGSGFYNSLDYRPSRDNNRLDRTYSSVLTCRHCCAIECQIYWTVGLLQSADIFVTYWLPYNDNNFRKSIFTFSRFMLCLLINVCIYHYQFYTNQVGKYSSFIILFDNSCIYSDQYLSLIQQLWFWRSR